MKDIIIDECPGCGKTPHANASSSHDPCGYHYGIIQSMNWVDFYYGNLKDDNPNYPTLLEDLIKNSKPSDYIFAFFKDEFTEDFSVIYIIPKQLYQESINDYYESSVLKMDEHIDISHLLPEEFGSDMECIWSCELSEDVAKNMLTNLGFEFSQQLQDLLQCDD